MMMSLNEVNIRIWGRISQKEAKSRKIFQKNFYNTATKRVQYNWK